MARAFSARAVSEAHPLSRSGVTFTGSWRASRAGPRGLPHFTPLPGGRGMFRADLLSTTPGQSDHDQECHEQTDGHGNERRERGHQPDDQQDRDPQAKNRQEPLPVHAFGLPEIDSGKHRRSSDRPSKE